MFAGRIGAVLKAGTTIYAWLEPSAVRMQSTAPFNGNDP